MLLESSFLFVGLHQVLTEQCAVTASFAAFRLCRAFMLRTAAMQYTLVCTLPSSIYGADASPQLAPCCSLQP